MADKEHEILDVQSIMQDLLDAADVNMRNDTGLQFLAPGAQVAWDNCCDDGAGVGGQLWVRCMGIWPTTSFPQKAKNQNCGTRIMTAQLAVGAIRCVHTINDQGIPPSGAQMTGDAVKIMQDADDMFEGIRDNFGHPHVVDQWSPLGPDGGCGGGEWQLFVRLTPCK